MSGETPVVVFAGRSMTQIISAIPVVAEQTGRAVVLVGGLAVMSRLPTPYPHPGPADVPHSGPQESRAWTIKQGASMSDRP